MLLVLDGWGYRAEREGNAVALANTPTWDALVKRAPRTLLDASGLPVGLPEGQMGNSEVGHLNLGAGRVVPQDLVRISQAIGDGSFFGNSVFVDLCRGVKRRGTTLHLCGLLGDGGVHAIDTHLYALIDLAEREGLARVAMHVMTDGRDTLPHNGLGYMRKLVDYAHGRARVASVGGRYFGMDRDQRWQRTEKWYRAAVAGVGPSAADPLVAIQAAYDRGVTDEFIEPMVIASERAPATPMREGDGVIFFNYRSDRMRQPVRTLIDPTFAGFDVAGRPAVDVATMTMYEESFPVPAAFPAFVLSRIVAEVVSERGMTMFRTAETEKYAHVTYFFNGGFETPYAGEVRELVPSQKVATYDLAPEMSARPLTDVLTAAIESREHDFILCNYANGDMVGHSGVLSAAVRACETVDECLARVLKSAERAGARVLVTADHGNCEMMIDPATGGPHTAHTTNPVPIVIVDPDGDRSLRSGGALRDVGPTVLAMLGVDKPSEMTGVDLRVL